MVQSVSHPDFSMPMHMPQPRLALNIGISGHRPNKLNARQQALVAQKFRALAGQITDAVQDILQLQSNQFYSGAQPLLRIVTGLADGADRLAVANMPAGWTYEAILPMPRNEYARDFKAKGKSDLTSDFGALLAGASSVTELPLQPDLDADTANGRAAYYGAHGDFLIRQIEILVTIWDGGKAEGQGGTAEVVEKAIALGLPVIWIDLEAGVKPHLVTQAQPEEGGRKVIELGARELSTLLHKILAPPKPAASHKEHGPDHHSVEQAKPSLSKTPWPKTSYLAFAYPLLRRICGAGRMTWPIRYGSPAQHMNSWAPFFGAVTTADEQLSRNLTESLLPRSIWADALAWYYGQIYRSAYVSVFILASISVPIGLCYLFFLSSPLVLDIKAAFVVIELLIISTIVVVVRRGIRDDWHGQWLQTRKLSELLRLGRNIAYVGASRSFISAPTGGQSEDFPDWYVRATFREAALPDAVFDENYLRVVLAGLNNTEIAEQRAYHRGNAANLSKIHHVLHHLGDLSFMATIGFLLLYLLAWGIDSVAASFFSSSEKSAETGPETGGDWFHETLEFVIKPIVSIAAAGLPALGAALTGIREQGDFEGFAERSKATERQLSVIEAKIKSLLDGRGKISLRNAQDILLTATQIMAKDVSAWHEQYSSKRLSLPA